MKKYELTAKEVWKLLAIDVIDKPFEAEEWTGSFVGSKSQIYFSCGEINCCEDWWNTEEEFLSDHENIMFRLIETNI